MNDFVERISKLSPKRLVLLAAELQARVQAAEAAAAASAGAVPASAPAMMSESVPGSAVAVIGMGLRFPGGAADPQSFWEFLARGGDGIEEVPPERWDVTALFDADPDAPGKMASRWGGFVRGIDQFDPQFFGITPREAATMDPQQRMMLEVCWETLERSGYAPDRLAGSPTGVFAGACNGDYYQLLLATGGENMDMYTSTGNAHSVISGRISYLLGLQGPSLTVDTACSSSLVAIHLACRSLQAGECRLALAGGVNAILSPDTTIALSKAKMMAADGRCKAFDAHADGFVRAEGCGVVLLKRLDDALADGDQILAVVRGSAINQDGRSNGLTAPNGPAQVAVLRAALAAAGVQGGQIGYVETHGTGTPLGDPIEIQALAEAYGAGRAAEQPLWLGSVKTNIGHLESAAGVAGFIKLVLALEHKTIPPHLHLQAPNPHIAWDELPVMAAATGGAWAPIDGRRLGGVSSFGFSGTNVHMILEAAPEPAARPADPASEVERPLQLLALSARSPAALHELAGRFAAALSTTKADWADIVFTANNGRATFAHRLAIVAATRMEAAAALAAYAEDPHAYAGHAGGIPAQRRPQVAFLFSGHGGQYAGMGRVLYATEPAFRKAFDRCDELFRRWLPIPLRTALAASDPGASTTEAEAAWFDSMMYAQPLLFSLQIALAEMWQSWGVIPQAVLGHSLGEYAAACVAGVMSLADAAKLVAARARLMDSIPTGGVMYAVFAGEEQVQAAVAAHAADAAVAAINGPQTIVISGAAAAVEAVVADLARNKIRSRRLAVAQGAHSPLIDGVLCEFESVAATVTYAEPQLTYVSCLLGRPAATGEVTQAGYWRDHLRRPVRFADAMYALAQPDGGQCDVFLEIGPSPTLLAMGQRCLPDATALWAPSLRQGVEEWRQVLDSAAALYTYGVTPDWAALGGPARRRRVPLPTYPFERQRYWFAARAEHSPRSAPSSAPSSAQHSALPAAGSASTLPATGLLGTRLRSPALHDIVYAVELGRHQPAYLADHAIFDVVILPSPAYLELALDAAVDLYGAGAHAVENLTIYAPLLLPEQGTRSVQLILPPAAGTRTRFQVHAFEEETGTWKLHAAGDLLAAAPSASPGEPAGAFDPAALQARCPHHMESDQYYARVRDLGLTFGESFRGIRAVWTGDGEALGRIALPPGLAADAATYHFHPALLDACFHLLGAPLMQDGMDEAYLLIGIDSFRLYRTPGVTLWNHTRIRPRMGSGGETFAGDIRLYDDAGALVAEALGLQLKRADRAALLRAVGRRPADWIYQVVWQPQPLTPAAGTHGPADGWLIFADAAGVGEALASRLRARGNCCLLVEQGTALVEGTDRWQIDPFAPEQFQHLLAKAALPQFGKVVYLWGCASPSGGQPDHIFGGLLHLVQALVQYTAAPASKLWVATCQAQPVLGPPAETGMRQATLWGLGRVAALEHPQLWGGLVDLELEDVQLGAAQLLAEVDAAAAAAADPAEAAGAEDQVAWRGGDRYVPRLLRSPAPPPQSIAVSPGAAYLVTGGLGGLGLQVAHWLAEHGARHLVLIGRRGLPPQVMTAAPDPQFGATLEAIRHIEALGATVTVLAADVASHADMAALFARFGADLPPLGGIVHAAAALSSAPLAALAWPDVAAMLHPKVAGTLVLHELSAGLDLDFFVLFSSTTALLGAQGLAHYAAANAFLDAFAAYRRSLGLPALSINWGTWNVMRAASVTERQRAAEVGLQQMPAEQALALLGDFLAAPPQPQVVIAAVDWAMLKPTYEARRRRPFLAAVGLPAGRPASLQMADPAARAADLPAQTLAIQYQAAHPQDRRDLLIAALRQAVAKVVGLADPRAIDLHQGLFEMGLDSLMSVELKTRLEREVGQALPPTLTFNYPTIHDLATYLEQEILVETKEIQTPPPAARSVPAPEQAPQTGEAEIDELSEDELAGRLLERLRHLH